MKKKLSLVLAGAMVLSMALTGCGGSGSGTASTTAAEAGGETAAEAEAGTEAAAGGESSESDVDTTGFLVTPKDTDIQTADVQKTSADYELPLNIYDRLVDIKVEDGVSSIEPSLAEEWEISDDGLEYTFHLRQGVKFHNGNDFTAEDVVYTFNRLLTVSGAMNTELLEQVQGAAEVLDGSATEISGIEAVDDYTVKITLVEPFGAFLSCMTAPGASIYDSEATEAAGDQFGLDPAVTVGTGPFKFVEWTLNDRMVLVRNDDYWKEPAGIPGVLIRIVPDTETQTMMFESGELDIIDLDEIPDAVDRLKATYPDQIVEGNRVGVTYMIMNYNVEPLNNIKVRQAIQHAIDRQAILDALYGGMGTVENGIYPHGLIGFNNDLPAIEYDPELAKSLLAEAGYADGFTMELANDTSSGDAVAMTLEIIKEQLAEVGITAEIKNYDESSWLDLRNSGEMCAFTATWTADFNDPDNFIYTFFGNEEKSKIRSLNYPDADKMARVTAARAMINEDERIAEYRALEKEIIQDDAAWVPMYSRVHLFAVSKRVQGFTPFWSGYGDKPFYGITFSE